MSENKCQPCPLTIQAGGGHQVATVSNRVSQALCVKWMIINCPASKGPAAWLTSVKQPQMVIRFYLINAHRTMGWPGSSVLERNVVTSLALCRLLYLSSLQLSRQFLSPPHVRPTDAAIAGWHLHRSLFVLWLYVCCVCVVLCQPSASRSCADSLCPPKNGRPVGNTEAFALCRWAWSLLAFVMSYTFFWLATLGIACVHG